MARKHEPAPEFLSEGEERAYWECHGSVDHVDWSKATRARLPNLRPSSTSISLRLPNALLERLKIAAEKRGVPYRSLIETWLTEKLDAPTK